MTDLIKREDAIEVMEHIMFHDKRYLHLNYRERRTALVDAITMIKKIPSVEAVSWSVADKIGEERERLEERVSELEERLEWIPCSERLPKHGDDVLVTYSDGEVSIVMGARSKYWMKWGAMENSNLILPIAWMPLPKPYKGDSK